LKRSEDEDVRTEVSSRLSQTQVESEVAQVIVANDHSDTATNAADCGPDTDEGLEACEPLRLKMERPLIETKQEMRREVHGLGMEIGEILQEMGREMRDMRYDMGSEMRAMQQGMSDMERKNGEMGQKILREMRHETGALKLEMRQEMSEMQKEMKREISEMQQKMQDVSMTASHADVINLATAASDSGRSKEKVLQDMTADITYAGNIVFFFSNTTVRVHVY